MAPLASRTPYRCRQRPACGDNHSCALDSLGRVWLWTTYKDSNGHIGAARRRKPDAVSQKSTEPSIVLESAAQTASGANHTLAMRPCAGTIFAWGSNATRPLGLRSGAGCGFDERVPAGAGAGSEIDAAVASEAATGGARCWMCRLLAFRPER